MFFKILALIFIAVMSVYGFREAEMDNRKKEDMLKATIVKNYNLSSAKKQDAIAETVLFLMNQRDILSTDSSRLNRQQSPAINCKAKKTSSKSFFGNQCSLPICNVSIAAVLSDGVFVHLPEVIKPPYDHTCFSMRARYHVAPKCYENDHLRKVEPIYRWRWSLRAAEEGYCQMPEISPDSVGINYRHRARITTQKKTTTILMLGLSFLSEPFMALGCLYPSIITGGMATVSSKQRNNLNSNITTEHQFMKIQDIRHNGGQCTGYDLLHIKDFFPTHLHPNLVLPRQNTPFCTMDHAYLEFGNQDEGITTVCFSYTFNIPKNVKKNSKLPCNIDSWANVDVVLHLPSHKSMLTYLDRTGWENFVVENKERGRKGLEAHVVKFINVNYIYENMILSQLKTAYNLSKIESKFFDRNDILAKFSSCESPDVHYRMPGIPDFAARIWLSLISTGLGAKEDDQFLKPSTSAVDSRPYALFWL